MTPCSTNSRWAPPGSDMNTVPAPASSRSPVCRRRWPLRANRRGLVLFVEQDPETILLRVIYEDIPTSREPEEEEE